MIAEPAPGVQTYVAPGTLSEVIDLLAEHGDEAKVLAGGQSLLVLLRQGLITPSVLVSLRNVAELRSVSSSDAGGVIGAMTTQAAIASHPDLRTRYAALTDAASVVATRQVRTLGTLGGNLCHADPTADPPAALIALAAELEIVGPRGTRRVSAEAFFKDYMEVDLGPDEVLARIHLPASRPGAGSAYLKYRLREVDTALVGAAAWVCLEADVVQDVRVGLAGAAATPLRSLAAEAALRGQSPTQEAMAQAAHAAAEACDPLSDTEASDWYRREMVGVFVRRALEQAIARARGVHA